MPQHRPMTQAQAEREWLDSCREPNPVVAFLLQAGLVIALMVVFL